MNWLLELVSGSDGKLSNTDFMSLTGFSFALFWAGYSFYYVVELPHFEFVFSSLLIFSGGLKGYKYGMGTWAYTKEKEQEGK